MFNIALIDLFNNGYYGLRCISSNLSLNGIKVNNIFANNALRDTPELPQKQVLALEGLLKDLRPGLIGFSVMSTMAYPFIARIAERIKPAIGAPIIFGGVFPTLEPEFCLKDAPIDYVCIGEGEESMVEFCGKLRDGIGGMDIAGIMSSNAMNYTRRDAPQDLDRLPFQALGGDSTYNILKNGSVLKRDPLLKSAIYATKCTRGCPFHCSTCSNAALESLYAPGKFLRFRSVDNVIAEIKQYRSLNPSCKRIRFWDDTFPSDQAWVSDFSEKYKKEIALPFVVWLNPDRVKDENIAALRSAGLIKVTVGIESACDETRQTVFLRTETRENILNMDSVFSKYGIERVYDFLFDHPWESDTELDQTIELLLRFRRPFALNLHSCILLPGTRLAKQAVEEGYIKEEQIIANIVTDPLRTSRKILWEKGIPLQADPVRQYLFFLILCTQKKWIPKWLIRLASSSRIRNNSVLVKALVYVIGRFETRLR